MAQAWDEARVQQYIDDEIEESLNLDYKAAGALQKKDGKKREITKDVSAMANSDGGIIIYGVTEDGHLPGTVDPIDRQEFSKDWLDNIVSNIRPNIEGVVIHPVPIKGTDSGVVYVVEIPQSDTAHQALDKKYYRRVGFKSRPMDDYEIRDVMNRQRHPLIELKFRVRRLIDWRTDDAYRHEFEVEFNNVGKVYAQYIVAILYIPCGFFTQASLKPKLSIPIENESHDYCEFTCENTVDNSSGSTLYKPILPGLGLAFAKFDMPLEYCSDDWMSHGIVWWTKADNAPAKNGITRITDVEIAEFREPAI